MTARSHGEVTPFVPRGRSNAPAALISKSRLVPPRLPLGLVGADKAGEWMESVLANDITLVRAPPAYGKTVFAARIYHEMRDAGFCAAWVSCGASRGGDEAAHIVQALTMAISAEPPPIGADGAAASAVALANRVYDYEEPVLLCLDGVDGIDARADTAFLDELIGNCPTNLHFLLTARRRTDAVDAWTACRPSVRDIGASALALSDAELADYFAADSIALREDEARQLNAALFGWWGGAQTARAARAGEWRLRPGQNWDELCAQWSAASFGAALGELGDTEQWFLLRCAVAPIVHPTLASLLTGLPEAEAQALLARLVADACFIEKMPGFPVRYHLHPSFRRFLITQLLARDRAAVGELCRRASAWHIERGDLLEAVEIAFGTDDAALLADLIAVHGSAIIERAGPILLRRALDRLDADRIAEDKRLASLAQVVAAMDHGASAMPADLAARMSPLIAARSAAALGEHIEAQNLLAPILQHARAAGVGYVEALAFLAGADARRALGHPADAERMLRDGRDRLRESDGARSDAALVMSIALADSLYRQNDLAGLGMLVDGFLPFLGQIGDNEAVLRGYRVAIRLAVAQGHVDEAMGLIERVEEAASVRDWLPLAALGAVERMRIHAPLVTPLESLLPADMEEEAIAEAGRPRARAFALLSEVRAYEAILQLDRPRLTVVADRLLRLAERLNDAELRVIGTLLHILPQLSGRCDRMVEIDTARFLNHAAGIGFVRTIVDLLQITGVRTAQDFNAAEYSAGTFLGLLRLIRSPDAELMVGSDQPVTVSAFSFLSQREMEVVAALGAGETNKMIARGLGLTPETVKWHMKSLMRKLRAGTRDEVVANARMLGFVLGNG